MKRVLCLFLAASFLSLYSEESDGEVPTSELSFNELTEEKSPLLSANELGDFKGGIEELSFKTLTEEKDPLLSLAEPKKNGLYFFLPTGLHSFFLPGFAFRHHLSNRRFLEVSYFNEKHGDIILTRYESFFEVESTEKIGAIYENMLSASYGFKWNTRYVDPYFSFGAGLYLPYIQYYETSYVDSLPAISSAIGLGFKYGFVDLTINYFPKKWTTAFEYQEAEGEHTFKFKRDMHILANLRLGAGFPF